VNFSKYGDYLATGAMDSIVILWQSNMETTHNYIEDQKIFAENDNYNTNIKNQIYNAKNIINNSNYDNFERTNDFNHNQGLNIDSVDFSNKAIIAELNNKKQQEKTIYYKNKNFPVLDYDEEVDSKEHLAENLSKLFEKMVYQLEIVTR